MASLISYVYTDTTKIRDDRVYIEEKRLCGGDLRDTVIEEKLYVGTWRLMKGIRENESV